MWKSVDGRLDLVNTHTAFDAAEEGDAAAREVIDRYIEDLACGLTNLINIFQPEIICIGGGLANRGDDILMPLRARVAREVFSRGNAKNTQIKKAELGNDAGVIGAANIANLQDVGAHSD
jgi:glucokinase